MMWQGDELSTYGEIGSALCELATTDEAAEFWQAYIDYLSRPDANLCGKPPEKVAASTSATSWATTAPRSASASTSCSPPSAWRTQSSAGSNRQPVKHSAGAGH